MSFDLHRYDNFVYKGRRARNKGELADKIGHPGDFSKEVHNNNHEQRFPSEQKKEQEKYQQHSKHPT